MMTATVTYTDVHLQRLLFFQSLFESFAVHWEDTRSRKDAAIELEQFEMERAEDAAEKQAGREDIR
jgi:hypothetical protein